MSNTNININELQVVFKRTGGHSHDGINSSLIDSRAYSIFDWNPSSTSGLSSSSPRAQQQARNKETLKSFIVAAVEERVLNPQGVVLKANSIRGSQIAANTITSDQLTANLVLVNNIIRSNNFNGSFYANGNLQSAGTTGWGIANTGAAVFNNITIRGSITGGSDININNGVFTVASNGYMTATSGTIAGINITSTGLYAEEPGNTGYSTYLYNNGRLYLNTIDNNSTNSPFSTFISAIFTGQDRQVQIFGNGIRLLNNRAEIDNSYTSFFTLYDAGKIEFTDGTDPNTLYAYIRADPDAYDITIAAGSNIKANSNGIYMSNDLEVNGSLYCNAGFTGNSTGFFGDDLTVQGDVDASKYIGGVAQLSLTSNTASAAVIDIYRSGATNMSRHINFLKSNGAYVGSIRYKDGDNNTMVFDGDITGTSDLRLKENIKILTNTLQTINNLEPVEFNFKKSPNITQHGFIAQDLYEVYPMAVEKGGDDPETHPWSVMPVKLLPILTGAVKELSQKITDLENRLNEIEGV